MKKRVAYLVIDGKRFGNEYHGLDMSFDVNYTGTNLVPNNSTFTISNLNTKDMYEVVTNIARFIERRRKIECWAGYEGNVKQIFAGEILQSNPVNMPDTTVSISALSNINAMGKQVKYEQKNPKFIDLLTAATKACDLQEHIPASVRNSEKLQSNAGRYYSFSGSSWQFLQEVESAIAAHTDQSRKALAFPIQNNTLYVYWEGEEYPSFIPTISKETGLIGIPTPTETGINFRTLLDISLSPLQTINLQSKLLPLYNGKYNIINIRHHGSLRGNDWYSELECNNLQ